MDYIFDKFTEWIKNLLVNGIMNNLSGLFDNVNTKVQEISTQVGSTPQAWNSNIFNMIKNLSDNVILPIAGVILAIVMTLELKELGKQLKGVIPFLRQAEHQRKQSL